MVCQRLVLPFNQFESANKQWFLYERYKNLLFYDKIGVGDFMKEVRTRFAPSPTGFMHIGGVRTALYAYLIAKKHDGKFILRIEDTDQNRFVEGAIDVIYSTLKDLGLNWDEGPDVGGPVGPYIQSERKANYLNYAKQLIDEGKAYYCFCNEEKLDLDRAEAERNGIPYKYDGTCRDLPKEDAEKRMANGEKAVIRFKMPKEGTVSFEDKVYGRITVEAEELEDLIMIKSDLMPTYNFANIIDDTEMKISHVVRGNEYVSSTPKYVLMYQALGFDVPEFIHLPVIKKNKDSDKKLSKRDGDATVEVLKGKGYLNKSIINMLALTGWSSKDNKEIFTLEELVEAFDVDGIGKGNAIFDTEKLNWLNNHYIRELSKEEYSDFIYPFVEKAYDISMKDRTWVNDVVSLYQEQLRYGEEIKELISLFFEEEISMNEECIEFMKEESISNTLKVFREEVLALNDWNPELIMGAIQSTKEKANVKGKLLFMPIRIQVTGQMHGPELPNTLYLLGKEKILRRLES